MDSEFYVYIDKKGIKYGVFLNNSIDNDLYFNQSISSDRTEIIKAFKKYKFNNIFNLYSFKKIRNCCRQNLMRKKILNS